MKLLSTTLGAFFVIAMATPSPTFAGGFLTSGALNHVGRGVRCSVVNAGKKDIEIRVQIVQTDGSTLLSVPSTVAPGQVSSSGATAGGDNVVYCRVEVLKGPRRSVRGTLCVHETTSSVSPPCVASSDIS